MYYSPFSRYEAYRRSQIKAGFYFGLVFGGSFGVLAGYLLKTFGG